ncbi:alpha-mannosidase [Brachybacterium vulturis]|uniref:Alpha-mannosidase n=1 Tax=Brachybacterium vulturis TaxID=2017484 RepID=A0A291GKB5_9MICO|nr:glycoside hydrolase family 38 C-terminal domain-containing protein [Brachybacterium vulturis]ATG50486.1 alpha-mannosidase [Brachybacterium vulturis]
MFQDDTRILARVDRAHRERILPALQRDLGPLSVSSWVVPGDGEPVPPGTVPAQDHVPVSLPHAWGAPWSTTWFRLEGIVPAVAQDAVLRLEVDLGFKDDWPGNQCEGLLFDATMTPLKAINSRNRSVIVHATVGDGVRFHLEAAANPDMMERGTEPTELGDRLTAPQDPLYSLRSARWVVRDETVWGLWHDVDVLRGLAGELGRDSVRRARVLSALDDAIDALDLHDVPGTAAAAREVLAPALAAPAAASALRITTIGHAHIDSAWLWPVRETVRKVARTFSNVTALMQEYPELTFTATSAQQYEWLQEHQPDVFERVRSAVADGRWFPAGGMWVESDATMPGGEALLRQFTYGTRYFETEFGIRSRTLWLPDSFGYSAALPQIARQLGMDGFLTQKISWNRTNQHPHSTFWWEGLDGSRLFTHFPPVDCYDSMLTADEIAHAERTFQEKGRASHQVIPFGYGDGGGGPTADMLERARRRADLEGSPRLRMGDPDAFFDAARAEYAEAAPTYRGELYLEFHRGIFTSQLEMKQGNRRAEHSLRELELVWTMVGLAGLGTLDRSAVDALWKRTLLLQFHDILPGSSIAWVHRDARADHAEILSETARLTGEGLALLAAGPEAIGLLNPGPHPRREVIELGGTTQLVEVPASSLTPLEQVIATPRDVATAVEDGSGGAILRNSRLEVHIDPDGALRRVHDREHDREVLAPGARGNELQLFEDVPNEFDAWDIDRHYRGNHRALVPAQVPTLHVLEDGPLRASVRIQRVLGESPAIMTISLDAESPQINVSLDVDWHERETLLKAAFPLAVRAERTLAETQFGHVARELHENTSWEFAKFETVMHRWVLAAGPGEGAALITDSTYGYDAMPWYGDDGTGTLLRLSLMRSPNWPDPRADRSRRRLRYSLLVDPDPVAAAHAGYALNQPLRVTTAPARACTLAQIEDPGVHVEAVLPAHDGSGDVIVRLYEGRGVRTRTTLRPGFAVQRAWEVDPLDEPLEQPQVDLHPGALVDGAGIPLTLHPFQIVSLRLTPEAAS